MLLRGGPVWTCFCGDGYCWVGGWEGLISVLVSEGEGPAGPGLSQFDIIYPHRHGELLKEGVCLILLTWSP